MLPLRISGANAVFEGQGFPDLHVKVRNNIFHTAWEPTPEEVEHIKNGGKIIISCWGMQPFIFAHAHETTLEYRDYVSPYKPKVYSTDPDWPHVEAAVAAQAAKPKRRGRKPSKDKAGDIVKD